MDAITVTLIETWTNENKSKRHIQGKKETKTMHASVLKYNIPSEHAFHTQVEGAQLHVHPASPFLPSLLRPVHLESPSIAPTDPRSD